MECTASEGFSDSGQIRLTPEQAQSRYQVKSGAYYKRLEAAGVKHRKDDEGPYLDAEQVEILDRLDAHLKNGGLLADFSKAKLSIIQKGKELSMIATAEEVVEESVSGMSADLAEMLDKSAQSVAASFLVDARNRVTAEYLQNPHRLDNKLKEQVFIHPTPGAVDRAWAGHHLAAAIFKAKAGEV